MQLMQIDDWRQFRKEGRQYLAIARRATHKRPDIFTPEIIYNILCMAIEKLLMGVLMSRGDMADNHTMMDMLHSLARHFGELSEFASDFRFIDSFQEICNLDTFNRRPPQPEELQRIYRTACKVEEFCEQATAAPA